VRRNAHRFQRYRDAGLLGFRVSINLARRWCKQGKRSEARDLLASIYNWFTEGLGAADLKGAKDLLDELAQ
jgi:hypothetical protein